ncbi:MAG: FG-GAP repeat protein, partial [Proteobacteria bacterium]|nr:FG-GAP repeat protein [Pseudomonadota bacterium]
ERRHDYDLHHYIFMGLYPMYPNLHYEDKEYCLRKPADDSDSPPLQVTAPTVSGHPSDGATKAQTLYSSDADIYDYFGYSVAMSADGGTLAVGAPLESSLSPRAGKRPEKKDKRLGASGAVSIYVRTSGEWVERAWLKPSKTDAGDRFGDVVSLSADGKTLAVSAPREDGFCDRAGEQHKLDRAGPEASVIVGAVYIFVRSSEGRWTQSACLTGGFMPAKGKFRMKTYKFGISVAISGDGQTMAVIEEDNNAYRRVYVYARKGEDWMLDNIFGIDGHKINEYNRYIQFATSISLDDAGTKLAIGAPGYDTVYVYARSNGGWRLQTKLAPPGPELKTGLLFRLGMSVSLSGQGDRLVVSAFESVHLPSHDINGLQTCSDDCFVRGLEGLTPFHAALVIYEFVDGSWRSQSHLRLPPVIPKYSGFLNDYTGFLYKVKMSGSGNAIIIGGSGDDDYGTALAADENDGTPAKIHSRAYYLNNYGAAWLAVRKDGLWQTPVRIQPHGSEKNDRFGSTVAIDAHGHTFAAGAPGKDASPEYHPDLTDSETEIIDAGSVFVYTRSGADK